MTINPYLEFDGRCEEAFRFYEKCLGTKIEFLMHFRDVPDGSPVPEGWGDKVMHASMDVGGVQLMGSDGPPEMHQAPQGFSVSLQVAEPGEAERVFAALGENGAVKMPIQETFWAKRFGMLVDQFGVPWMVNCSKPM